MGDPFSAASGAIGVISLGLQIAEKLYAFGKKVRNARKEVQELESSLAGFKPLLECLLSVLSDSGPDSSPDIRMVESLIERCLTGFIYIHDALPNFEKNVGQGKVEGSLQRVGWALKGDDIKALVRKLEEEKAILQLALQLSTRNSVMTTQMLVREREAAHLEQATDLISTIRDVQNQNKVLVKETQDSAVLNLREHTTTHIFALRDDITASSDKVLNGMQYEFQQMTQLFMKKLSDNNFSLPRTMDQEGRASVVHSTVDFLTRLGTRKRMKVRTWKSALGTLIFTTTVTTSSYRDDGVKTEKKDKEVSLMYLLPSPLMFLRGVVATFMPSSFGLSVHLPAWREIPYGHEAFDVCKRGDLKELRRMILCREITVWDFEDESDEGNHDARGTLLHAAIQDGHLDIAEFLISQGADLYFSVSNMTLNFCRPDTTPFGLKKSQTAAIVHINPLSPPVFASLWDDPCPNSLSASILVLRMFDCYSSLATPHRLYILLSEFFESTAPDIIRFRDVFNFTAQNIIQLAQEDENFNVADFSEVIRLVIEKDLGAPLDEYAGVLEYTSHTEKDPEAIIFDLLIRFLQQKYPHYHRERIPSLYCIRVFFRHVTSKLFQKFFDVYSGTLAMYTGLILRGLDRNSPAPSELRSRLQYACKMSIDSNRPNDVLYSFEHDAAWSEMYTEDVRLDAGASAFVTDFLTTKAETCWTYTLDSADQGLKFKLLKLEVLSFNVHGVVRLLRRYSYSLRQLDNALGRVLMAIEESKNSMSFFDDFEKHRESLMDALGLGTLYSYEEREHLQRFRMGNDCCSTYTGCLEAHFRLGFHCIKRILESALETCDEKQHQRSLFFTDAQEDCFEEMCRLQNRILRYWSDGHGDACQNCNPARSQPLHQEYIEALRRFLDLLGGCNCAYSCQSIHLQLAVGSLRGWRRASRWEDGIESESEFSESESESTTELEAERSDPEFESSSSVEAIAPPHVGSRYSIPHCSKTTLVIIASVSVNIALLVILATYSRR